jgi:uncharacterized protein with ParB-like and HNH nuclease domain
MNVIEEYEELQTLAGETLKRGEIEEYESTLMLIEEMEPEYFKAVAIEAYQRAGSWTQEAMDTLTDAMVARYPENEPEFEAKFSALREEIERAAK